MFFFFFCEPPPHLHIFYFLFFGVALLKAIVSLVATHGFNKLGDDAFCEFPAHGKRSHSCVFASHVFCIRSHRLNLYNGIEENASFRNDINPSGLKTAEFTYTQTLIRGSKSLGVQTIPKDQFLILLMIYVLRDHRSPWKPIALLEIFLYFCLCSRLLAVRLDNVNMGVIAIIFQQLTGESLKRCFSSA